MTISEYNRRYLQRFINPDDYRKIKVIRCGIDDVQFQAHTYIVQQKNSPVFVCLARLHAKKGHQFLLEACAELVAQGSKFECWLIGDGELAEKIRADILRLKLGQTIKMLGPLSQPEVAQRLAAADYMVLPSITTESGRREGIPVSLMEGMAMGLTVIATELSGTPELVRHGQTGLLVPEKDSQALAAAMKRLLDEPKMATELAVAGMGLVKQQYDLRKNSRQLLNLFQNSQQRAKPDVESTTLATGKHSS